MPAYTRVSDVRFVATLFDHGEAENAARYYLSRFEDQLGVFFNAAGRDSRQF
mgnify:CR=1 FL=1